MVKSKPPSRSSSSLEAVETHKVFKVLKVTFAEKMTTFANVVFQVQFFIFLKSHTQFLGYSTLCVLEPFHQLQKL